jgi:hypothetical protein
MKKTSVAIMIIGVVATLFSNFGFVRDRKMVDVGLTRYEKNILTWPPWIGVFIIAVGAGVYIYGAKKRRTDL